MDFDASKVTIDDCMDMFEKRGQAAIINDGKLLGFEKEKEE